MGGASCQIIIINGTLAYGVVENFAEENSFAKTYNLEAAIKASCNAISHASLYFAIESEYRLTSTYTQPIIDLHNRIIQTLPNIDKHQDKHVVQTLLDKLTEELIVATNKTLELFD